MGATPLPAPSPAGLEKPIRTVLLLLKGLAGALVGRGQRPEQVRAHTGRDLGRCLEPFFRSAAGAPQAWQQAVAQVQVARRGELRPYVEAHLAEPWRAFVLATAPVLDVPAGFAGEPGPQPYPVLNWMQGVLAELARDRMTGEDLQAVLDALWSQFAEGMRRLEKDPDPLRSSRGQKGCREALASLQVLQGFLEGRRSALASGMERLLSAFEELDGVYLDGTTRALESGPSGTPAVNWLLHALMARDDGLLGDQVLTQARAWVRELAACHCAGAPAELLDRVPHAWDALALLATLEMDPAELHEAANDLSARILRSIVRSRRGCFGFGQMPRADSQRSFSL